MPSESDLVDGPDLEAGDAAAQEDVELVLPRGEHVGPARVGHLGLTAEKL